MKFNIGDKVFLSGRDNFCWDGKTYKDVYGVIIENPDGGTYPYGATLSLYRKDTGEKVGLTSWETQDRFFLYTEMKHVKTNGLLSRVATIIKNIFKGKEQSCGNAP